MFSVPNSCSVSLLHLACSENAGVFLLFRLYVLEKCVMRAALLLSIQDRTCLCAFVKLVT